MKFIKKSIFLIVLIVLGFYLLGVYFFSIYLMPNSYVNGKDMSFKKISDIEEEYENSWNNFTLTIDERNGNNEILKASDFDYSNKIIKREDIYQPYPFWFIYMLVHTDYSMKNNITYIEDKLVDVINNFKISKEAPIEPTNAYISYNDDKNEFEIISEVYGNIFDKDKLKKEIVLSFNEERKVLDMEELNIYSSPNVTAESETLISELNELNKLSSFEITINFDDRQEVLKGYDLTRFYQPSGNGELVVNMDLIKSYVDELASKYDTYKTNRIFYATGVGNVKVDGGIYGWLTDRVATAELIAETLNSKESKTIEPVYSRKAMSRKSNDIGNTYIEVDIARQHVWIYKDGVLLAETATVTGNPNTGFSTPTGTGVVWSKETNRYLSGEDYSSYVNYWMPFNWSGCGLHDASWRSSFGGDIYLTKGSHGCVNIPPGKMPEIFSNIQTGTPVIVYNSVTQKV